MAVTPAARGLTAAGYYLAAGIRPLLDMASFELTFVGVLATQPRSRHHPQ